MKPQIALDVLHQGCCLADTLQYLNNLAHKKTVLFGPCEYWESWYHQLDPQLKNNIIPQHQPLMTSISHSQLWALQYPLIITSQYFRCTEPVPFLSSDLTLLWECDYSSRVLYTTVATWPLKILDFNQWLELYTLSAELALCLFQQRPAHICLSSQQTGSVAQEQLASFKDNIIFTDIFMAQPFSVILLEPLCFQSLMLARSYYRPAIVNHSEKNKKLKSLFWFSPDKKDHPHHADMNTELSGLFNRSSLMISFKQFSLAVFAELLQLPKQTSNQSSKAHR